MACGPVALHVDEAADRATAFWPRTRPGRPLGLPGMFSRSTDSRSARFLLRGSAFDPHVRDHAGVDVGLRHRESLPVHCDILDPWLERILVNAIDNRDVPD